MKVIDARTGADLALNETVSHGNGESVTLLAVEPGILRARAITDEFGFCCAGCAGFFTWVTCMPIVGSVPIKTIGSRYCVGCMDREAQAHGISRMEVIRLRKLRGQAT